MGGRNTVRLTARRGNIGERHVTCADHTDRADQHDTSADQLDNARADDADHNDHCETSADRSNLATVDHTAHDDRADRAALRLSERGFPEGAKYERRDLGIGTYFQVLGPDATGNFETVGVALFDGGPVYFDTLCAWQEILFGPTEDKTEAPKLCETRPFPTGQHLEYQDAGAGISSFLVIGPDGLPESSTMYSYVVDGEQARRMLST